MSIGDCRQMAITLEIKPVLNEMHIQEITTLVDNVCNLEMVSGGENIKYVFLVSTEFSSVDGIQQNTQSFR